MKLATFLTACVVGFSLSICTADADAPTPRINPRRPLVTIEPMPTRPAKVCGSRERFVATAQRLYGEVVVARYLAADGAMVEVLGSPKGTVTVLVVQPVRLRGVLIACVASTGTRLFVALPGAAA